MSIERGTTARLSLSNFARKLSFRNREYNKVEDLYDTRIPLHNEEAFEHGLRFKAKFIGSLEIARPTCKIDIITAMRRIRYEYKVKGIRKVRAYVNVSTTGVKITKRKRKRSRKRYSEEQLFVMQHPIYRIFYVSHDSQDLKIFSYITREVPDNIFRCNVFKAYRKGLALTIVRSLGQAFDVCHKLNPKPQKKKKGPAESSSPETVESPVPQQEEKETDEASEDFAKEDLQSPQSVPPSWKQFNTDLDAALEGGGGKEEEMDKKMADINIDLMELNFDPFSTPVANGNPLSMDPFQPLSMPGEVGAVAYPPLTVSNLSASLPDFPDDMDPASASANVLPPHTARPRPRPSLSGQQQVVTENLFTDPNQSRTETESPVSIGEALDNIAQRPRKVSNPFHPVDPEKEKWASEKKQFFVHMKMMKDQLDSEKTARIESQARVEHLLMQNKELLSHLQKLMSQLSQIQTLQQSMVASAAPPTTSTPTTSPAPPQTTPTSDSNPKQQELLSNEAPPTETTSPAPLAEDSALFSLSTTKASEAADEATSPSDMSLGLDFNQTPAPASNDPFLPTQAQPSSSSN